MCQLTSHLDPDSGKVSALVLMCPMVLSIGSTWTVEEKQSLRYTELKASLWIILLSLTAQKWQKLHRDLPKVDNNPKYVYAIISNNKSDHLC